jgi:hypothetical protein
MVSDIPLEFLDQEFGLGTQPPDLFGIPSLVSITAKLFWRLCSCQVLCQHWRLARISLCPCSSWGLSRPQGHTDPGPPALEVFTVITPRCIGLLIPAWLCLFCPSLYQVTKLNWERVENFQILEVNVRGKIKSKRYNSVQDSRENSDNTKFHGAKLGK